MKVNEIVFLVFWLFLGLFINHTVLGDDREPISLGNEDFPIHIQTAEAPIHKFECSIAPRVDWARKFVGIGFGDDAETGGGGR